ncbi:CLUMA_CG006313, isoform B [Clunio marinus]|uniref:CLUMA_CG006313, isoform B n=1 Tax=Clunio marinus TaxID=568069 RepID=A0A1J1HXG4_9DIPT|nr:CLUMA_CG006313, isoform B [Clunio marinus]
MNQNEWEIRETQRQRELEEAKGRAQQMEKTMRWWSECTSNWREKWAKVRNERNQAREEAKQLRSQLESAVKESHSFKKEKNELEIQISQLKKEMEKVHLSLMKHAGQQKEPERDINESPDQFSNDGLKNVNSEDGLVTKARSVGENEDNKDNKIIETQSHEVLSKKFDADFEEKQLIQKLNSKSDDDDTEYFTQKLKMLQLRLDDAVKALSGEKDEKKHLLKSIDKLRQELEDCKKDAVREFLTMQETHHAELRIINNSLQEEMNDRESLERRLFETRAELERLQSENACEWAKRERLESEKITLERENKKIKAELLDFQVSTGRSGFNAMRPQDALDSELRLLQQELMEKNKEITELRHSQSKVKKMLSEANIEMGHAVRRAEQYETEVKRLRSRVEELKKELTIAEDELDSASSAVRRLQRTNEELHARLHKYEPDNDYDGGRPQTIL